MKKRNFSAEFKRESAQLVVDQNYTVADAAKAMDIGLSTMTRWVKQLRDERQGKTPKASPITPVNRPRFPGEYFICELRLPDHRFRWKHNKLFLLLPEEYGPAFPAIVDCYTSPPT
ncbi:transposase, partial [Escherichia coli]|uniref:transposase n=1 Tax=Escherichia coli TaxID=562 RepID=UPI0020237C9B